MALFGGPKKEEHGLKPGFREMKWGEAPRPGMTVLDENGPDRFCTIEGDDLSLGGASVTRIIYKFWQKRLSEVQIEIPLASVEPVFKHLQAEWGKPERPNRFIEDYFWQNDKQGVEATSASISKNPNTRAAILLILSRYIQAKRTLIPSPEPPVAKP